VKFAKHSDLVGKHAVFSASNYHWLRYDDEKFDRVFENMLAAQKGTELHDLAARLIRLGVPLRSNGQTLNRYVNDSIGWKLTPEQPLYYSDYFFGTPDAIGYKPPRGDALGTLRISDLKNGEQPGHMDQLLVYAALFCLEYRFNPFDIIIELRIYQYDDVELLVIDPDIVFGVMEKIKYLSKRAAAIREEVM